MIFLALKPVQFQNTVGFNFSKVHKWPNNLLALTVNGAVLVAKEKTASWV